MARTVIVHIDGLATEIEVGSSLLEACDAAGRYVPRLCHHPAVPSRESAVVSADRAVKLAAGGQRVDSGDGCGLCVVRLEEGTLAQACCTEATEGLEVCTDDAELRRLRTDRLEDILARHPHSCLSCPDREGCSRDSCPHGVGVEARCCDKLGDCELASVVEAIDSEGRLPYRAVAVSREVTVEGRIRREPGLCVACGRCVRICATAPEAGQALEMVEVAVPKVGTLRASGCSFCGLCVLVCATGALSAPGPAGVQWLAARREKHRLPSQVLPPKEREFKLPDEVGAIPNEPGVFTLLDSAGQILQINGVADLRRGVTEALEGKGTSGPCWAHFEVEPLYTQRESELLAQYASSHGHLPDGNDLADDLFGDDMFADDLD